MSEDRCVHEMLPGQCSICRPAKERPEFSAMYDGPCPLCAQAIVPGDAVRWSVEGILVQHARHR